MHFHIILASALLVAVLAACAPGATPTAVTPTRSPATSPTAVKPSAGATVSGTPASSAATGVATTAGSGAVAGDANAGRAVFETNCNSCHPAGRAGVGPALSGVIGRLGEDGTRSVIRNGRPGTAMPGFPSSRITDQQLTDMMAYLKSL